MATVYISKDLLERVGRTISELKDHEIGEAYPNRDSRLKVDASEFLTKASFAEHYHLKDLIPQSWMVQSSTGYLYVELPNEGKSSMRFENQTNVCFRPTPDRYNMTDVRCTLAFIEDNVDLPGVSEIKRIVDMDMAIDEIRTRWQTVAEKVGEFLKRCKSLNEAIKLWPEVSLYIHPDDMDRFNRKVERSNKLRTDVLEGIDTQELTAHAIAAKLSGAFQHS